MGRTLSGADSTRARRVSAVKSLLTFGHRTGYLPFNVGSVIRPPKVRDELSERILREVEVLRMSDRAEGRDRISLRVLYASACRVSEIVALDWKHVRRLTDGCSILTVHGKGAKTRHIRLDTGTADELEQLRTVAGEPAFVSRFGTRLSVRDAHRIVSKAAKRARIKANVSPHWIRHCAASHGLDRGAPLSVVQATLGHASVQTTGRYLHVRPGDGLANYLPV
jgi:integrase/recombinase XerD